MGVANNIISIYKNGTIFNYVAASRQKRGSQKGVHFHSDTFKSACQVTNLAGDLLGSDTEVEHTMENNRNGSGLSSRLRHRGGALHHSKEASSALAGSGADVALIQKYWIHEDRFLGLGALEFGLYAFPQKKKKVNLLIRCDSKAHPQL